MCISHFYDGRNIITGTYFQKKIPVLVYANYYVCDKRDRLKKLENKKLNEYEILKFYATQ